MVFANVRGKSQRQAQAAWGQGDAPTEHQPVPGAGYQRPQGPFARTLVVKEQAPKAPEQEIRGADEQGDRRAEERSKKRWSAQEGVRGVWESVGGRNKRGRGGPPLQLKALQGTYRCGASRAMKPPPRTSASW